MLAFPYFPKADNLISVTNRDVTNDGVRLLVVLPEVELPVVVLPAMTEA